jgi:four helix bundle protein
MMKSSKGLEDFIMQSRPLIPMQKLDAYRVAKEIAKRVHEAKIRDTELRDQATRAAKSCFLTLCEGLPNDGVAMRRKYFTESHNSLHEVIGAMDLAEAIGAVDSAVADDVQALAGRTLSRSTLELDHVAVMRDFLNDPGVHRKRTRVSTCDGLL